MDEKVRQFYSKSKHTNNWAVLVDTSRFWFNYRHAANTLALYRAVKRFGIPDSNIILMLSDDMACNPRNVFPGSVFHNENRKVNVYGEDVEVDYRGYEVTVENFIRVLTGRHEANVPRSKRLLTDESSNVLVYMTGHGGEEFLKFQDAEEINSQDIADAFEQMYQKKRYNEIFFLIDTCQANTLYKRFYSPNILAVGSSRKGENSYSHHADGLIGVSVVDRFTYYLLEHIERTANNKQVGTIQDLTHVFKPHLLGSHAEWRTDLFSRPLFEVPITDFFGAVVRVDAREIEISNHTLSNVDIENVDDKQFRIVNNNNNRHLQSHLDEKQTLNNVDKTIEKDVVSFPTIVACIALILVFSSISIVFEK